MWSLSSETRLSIRSEIERANPSGDVPKAQSVIEALIRVTSFDELRKLVEGNEFLCSDWVISIFSNLRREANHANDAAAAHNFSFTITTLSFFYERKLRSGMSIPRSLARDISIWKSLHEKQIGDMGDAELTKLVEQSRVIMQSADFDCAPEILQRDVYRIAGEAILQLHGTMPNDDNLDKAISYFSEACSLCSDTSMDFPRCTTYGGLALLLRYQSRPNVQDLDTAVMILRYAVAAASNDAMQGLSGQATNALTRAYLLRYEAAQNLDDLRNSAETFTYGVSALLAKDASLPPDTMALGAMVSEKLIHQPKESARLAALTDVLENAIGNAEKY